MAKSKSAAVKAKSVKASKIAKKSPAKAAHKIAKQKGTETQKAQQKKIENSSSDSSDEPKKAKAGKKKKAAKKDIKLKISSGEDSSSSDSSSDESSAKKAPAAKKPETKKEDSSDSDSSDSDSSDSDSSKPKEELKKVQKEAKKAKEDSDSDSSSSDDSSSDDDDKKDKKPDAKKGKPVKDEKGEKSNSSNSSSDSSSDSSSSSDDEDDAEPPAKKAKGQNGESVAVEKKAEPKEEDIYFIDKTRLYISDLKNEAKISDIFSFFKDCGDLKEVKILLENEESRTEEQGRALVAFQTEEGGIKAFKLNGEKIADQAVGLEFPKRRKRGNTDPRRINNRQNGRDGPPQRKEAPEGCTSIFVGNLSFQATSETLEEFFEDCGSVAGARIITDRESGESRGFGYVDFATKEEAQKAMKKNGTQFMSRNIKTDFAEKRSRPSFDGRPRNSTRGGRGGRGFSRGRGRGGSRGRGRGGFGNKSGIQKFEGKKTVF